MTSAVTVTAVVESEDWADEAVFEEEFVEQLNGLLTSSRVERAELSVRIERDGTVTDQFSLDHARESASTAVPTVAPEQSGE